MKTGSILLALAVVLICCGDACGYGPSIYRNRSIEIGDYRFGFADWSPGSYFPDFADNGPAIRRGATMMYAGPIGECQVPFTATQGLIGFCLILATLIILPVVLTVRRKNKRATS